MKIELNNITTLTEAEQLQILDWRNSKRVRSNMINQDIISKETHIAYCENLKKDRTTLLFRVSVNESPCGALNYKKLNYKSGQGEYGLYVMNNHPGVGMYLARLAVYYFFELLKMSELNMMVLAYNKRTITFNEKLLLFKDPYVKEKEFLINEQTVDGIHYTMNLEYWNNIVKPHYVSSIRQINFSVDGKTICIQ